MVKGWLVRGVRRLAVAQSGPEHPNGDALLSNFIARCRTMSRPSVLELGTKRSIADRSTMHKEWVPQAGEFLGSDFERGADVDIVADAHKLSEVTGEERFDIIIACSTFEHFKYPHLVAHQVMRALKVGGILLIQTHQCFPLHAYRHDYFRFSREALGGLFGTRMGFKVISTDYEFPARIFSARDQHSHYLPAFLNVRLYGEKTGPTPRDYIYELDA
jgi:SAM-dependent methyltransferase